MENDFRFQLSFLLGGLIESIDEVAELDGLCALLSAVGAACGSEDLERKLLEAITPIMTECYKDVIRQMNAHNN